ncbi:VOC family protein [Geminicoccus roseus]|uniref:VOC family protein n=1 Tax=Geminicoccus roseus TaxID=404900 RepID=UPI0004243A25|nr:VOC family protein [Geminicoccus roseus]
MTTPSLDFISLAVDDIERTAAFYRDGLGWPADRITTGDDHVKIDLEHGLSLVLYERSFFASQFGEVVGAGQGGGMIFSTFESTPDGVTTMVERAAAAGGRKVGGEPREHDWGGFAGYFADPDGHVWEVVCNPEDEED